MKMKDKRAGKWIRKARAVWRDTLILLAEFKLPLLLYLLSISGAGLAYDALSSGTDYPIHNLAEALYFIVTLTFLQPLYPFPFVWYLQLFYFVMPLVGLVIVALGLAEFSTLFFNRRTRSKEWQMAVASTLSNHVVLVGLGHLGYRVVIHLVEMDTDVVVIEVNPRSDLRDAILRLDVPLIENDATREMALEAAGVRRARTIILCTQNDSLNLEVALKARSLNPAIDVVVRIFDGGFAELLQKQFGFRALSATGMAAPIFAASAASVDITPPVTIEGRPHVLARLIVAPNSALSGQTVNHVEESFNISLVLIARDGTQIFHPPGSQTIQQGDSLACFGVPENIRTLIHANR